MKKRAFLPGCILFVASCCASVAERQTSSTGVKIQNIRILTDGSVDCSSPQAIAAATLKGTTDQEKALNFWHWYRRVTWHYKEWPERRDLTANLLSQGQTLCGSQAALQMMILRAGGYRVRPAFVEGGGHTLIELFFDDRWHALDAMTGFYIYSRTTPRHILSLAEMKADPELVRRAMAEGRVPAVFLACAREPEIVKKTTLPWSHFKTLPEMVEYFAQGVEKSSSGSEDATMGGSFTPGKMDVHLRPGERFLRRWDQETGRYPVGWAYPEDVATGPFHRCGRNDAFDTVNFPYWEPYLKRDAFVFNAIGGPVTISRVYRYLTHGRYERNLDAASLLAQASFAESVGVRSGALAATGVDTGRVEWVTTFPYFMCDAEITLSYRLLSEDSALTLQVLEREIGQPAPGALVGRTLFETRGRGDAVKKVWIGRFDHARLLGPRAFTLRLLLTGQALVECVGISTVFTHNMFAGPYLVPGRNKVTVTTDSGPLLKDHPLVVTYRFEDGENRSRKRTIRRKISISPYEFEIYVKGPKHPRMLSVDVEVK